MSWSELKVVEIVLPREVCERLKIELELAGAREIGGVLMGECLAPNRFRVADLTIQRRDGGVAWFIRRLRGALSALARFFRRTEGNYSRFNYLGEWHSHPSFAPTPSDKDVASMLEIAEDPVVGANFVALLIVRLSESGIAGSASVYWPDGVYEEAMLEMDEAHE